MFLLKESTRVIQSGLRHYHKIFKTKANAGIHKRRKLFADELDAQELQDEDMDFDDAESDFMNVHEVHRIHDKEIEAMQEKVKYHIVKRKYFGEKENNINFLTTHDKEQMKYLYASSPEEWTIEKLSESFPALPETVVKIVNANFKKKESRIRNHDVAVQRNWESFKKGEFPNLRPDLVEHLNKFTNRALNFTPFVSPDKKEITLVQRNIPSDFSEIITSYQKLKNKNNIQANEEETTIEISQKHPNQFKSHEDRNTYLTVRKDEIKDKRVVTLSQLHGNIEQKSLRGKPLSEDEKIILKDVQQTKEPVAALPRAEIDLLAVQNKYDTSGGGALTKKTERDYSHLIYPDRIKIPNDKVKSGYTYRLNDCYYDWDGEFLYRVPGMS